MRFIILKITFLFFCLSAQAQLIKPIKWSYSTSKTEVKVGETVELIFKANIDDVWYLYSSDLDPDLGPTVTTFEFEKSNAFKLVGKIKPIGVKEKYDSTWSGTVRIFKKHAEFRQTVKILQTNPAIKVTFNYQVCSDVEGKCIPFIEEYVFDNIKVIASAESIIKNNSTNAIPVTSTEEKPFEVSEKTSSLEKEKKKYTPTDRSGKDESIEYLRNFALKYGGTTK